MNRNTRPIFLYGRVAMAKNWTAPQIAKHKVSDGNEPLVMLTAYDAPGGRMVSEAGADIILVGDTLALSLIHI